MESAKSPMPALRVLEPGWQSLIVDFGRPRSRSLGVPVGGAADRAAFMLGNALVGNPPDAPALEIGLAGPRFAALCPLGCVVFGASFVLTSSRQALTAGTTFTLEPGEELRIGGTPSGMRAYLCVRGGFHIPVVLDSHSALAPLRADTTLEATPSQVPTRFIRPDLKWNAEPRQLRVVAGPQADWFREADFYPQDWTVTPASNRMGLRLRGRPLTRPQRELVSEPVCPGAVQVTHDGQCIVLGVDGQTIGGYPKIAQVIRADLDKLGQLRPDESIRFVPVSLAEAEAFDRRKQEELRAWGIRLRSSLTEPAGVVQRPSSA